MFRGVFCCVSVASSQGCGGRWTLPLSWDLPATCPPDFSGRTRRIGPLEACSAESHSPEGFALRQELVVRPEVSVFSSVVGGDMVH